MYRRPRLVILNGTCLDVVAEHRVMLGQLDVEVIAEPSLRNLKMRDADPLLENVQALVLPASDARIPTAQQMERHESLQVLSVAANGYDWLDVAAATRNGIVVTSAPVEEGIEAVADLTWGLILAVARHIPRLDRQVRAGDYTREVGVSVWGKTLGIIGLGRIGRAVARRAAGFSMEVLAHDVAPVRQSGVEDVSLDELLARSDFVSLHVPLSPATQHMFGSREFDLMKRTAYLINASRRELVDEEALAKAVETGRIAGVARDDPPPVPDSPLLTIPNVVFTPHVGNRAREGMNAVFRRAIQNAVDVLQGRRSPDVVNPDVYTTMIRAKLSPGSQVS